MCRRSRLSSSTLGITASSGLLNIWEPEASQVNHTSALYASPDTRGHDAGSGGCSQAPGNDQDSARPSRSPGVARTWRARVQCAVSWSQVVRPMPVPSIPSQRGRCTAHADGFAVEVTPKPVTWSGISQRPACAHLQEVQAMWMRRAFHLASDGVPPLKVLLSTTRRATRQPNLVRCIRYRQLIWLTPAGTYRPHRHSHAESACIQLITWWIIGCVPV